MAEWRSKGVDGIWNMEHDINEEETENSSSKTMYEWTTYTLNILKAFPPKANIPQKRRCYLIID